jgi:hypothetical protein
MSIQMGHFSRQAPYGAEIAPEGGACFWRALVPLLQASRILSLDRSNLPNGIEQRQYSGAVEVFDGHVLRQPLTNAPGDKPHDGQGARMACSVVA